MSTLTSSPSPAASPRAPAHPHIFVAPQRPNSKSPRFPPSGSPKTRIHATAASQRALDPTSQPSKLADQPSTKPQYANASTQYSPEGLPPTAHRSTTSGRPSATRKRRSSSLTPPPPPMNSISQSAAGLIQSPPPEPQPREVPVPATTSSPKQTLPERPAVPVVGATTSAADAKSKRARAGSDTIKIMPVAYETCNPKDLGILIANMLMELIRLNDVIPLKDGKLTRFHSRAPPGISCHDYLLRLIQHATLSPPILLSMVYYIDRLCAFYPAFTISSLTVHRFLITAATVAAKGLSDSFWTNPTYARIGGISTSELATLELEFLQRVDWKIVPKPETLVDYYNSLVQRSEGFELEAVAKGEDDSDEDMLSEETSLEKEEVMKEEPT